MNENLSLKDYTSVNTDSRVIKTGDIYLPLKGESFDGHDFIGEALQKGAIMAYSEKSPEELGLKANVSVIQVKDCLKTYHQLANEYRNLINPITIAITGSAGKTTAKELLRLVLAEKYRTHFTQANFNNEIGVPKTILSMPLDTEVLILEMGMRGLGEIELLSKTAEPNIALITNVGTAHIERLGSVENIRKAKLEIALGLKDASSVIARSEATKLSLDATLIVDETLYSMIKNDYKNFNLISFNAEPSLLSAELHRHSLISDGLVADINAVYKIAKLLGLSEEEVSRGLAKYRPGKGRGDFIYDTKGDLYIDETYNANPEAVRNSVYAMLKQFPDDYKIAVIGDILESEAGLIEELFSELKKLENANFKLLDGRGLSAELVSTKLAELQVDKRKVVLVKASRGAKFEGIVDALK